MTIQEAIQSGKPFRRKQWVDGMHIQVNNTAFLYDEKADAYMVTREDILATDWETKD